MTYVALCCGVKVIGRVVWIALGVTDPEEHCPVCGSWTKFAPEEQARPARKQAA